jgi:hypothetical protein
MKISSCNNIFNNNLQYVSVIFLYVNCQFDPLWVEYSDQLTSKQCLKYINLITSIYFRGHFWYFSHFKPYFVHNNTVQIHVGQIPCENRCGKLEDVNIFNLFFHVYKQATCLLLLV